MLISTLSDIAFLKKCCIKSQNTMKITIAEFDLLENGKLATLATGSTERKTLGYIQGQIAAEYL